MVLITNGERRSVCKSIKGIRWKTSIQVNGRIFSHFAYRSRYHRWEFYQLVNQSEKSGSHSFGGQVEIHCLSVLVHP